MLDSVNTDAATDVVAVQVFEAARRRGEQVSMALVRSVLAELASHPCGCCAACIAARRAKPERVYFIASQWFSSIEATRRRALR
jgi:hypothetical protein